MGNKGASISKRAEERQPCCGAGGSPLPPQECWSCINDAAKARRGCSPRKEKNKCEQLGNDEDLARKTPCYT